VQTIREPIAVSAAEQEQLLGLVERYLPAWLQVAHQEGGWFAGLRPIVRRRADFSSASREAEILRNGQLISVCGSKWTTARSLAERLLQHAPFNGQP